MANGFHSSTRLTFKKDIIEPLSDNDYYINDISGIGIFKITKKDFYKDFSNVVISSSYKEKGYYNYCLFPQKGYKYLIADKVIQTIPEKDNNIVLVSNLVSNKIRDKLHELGRLWKQSDSNPKINEKIKEKWEQLIIDWKENKKLPLIVRKGSGIRGSELVHITGRRIIITDNSFSQWVYSNVLDGIVYSLDDIDKMLKNDEIPMCFARKKEDANKIKFKKVLGNYSVNKRGWKLCHIDSVGLNSKAPIQKIDINELEKHFIKLGNPKNMFLLPLEIGSLGEIQEFIEEQKD